MENALLIKTGISFVVAGLWISGVTLISERLGSKRGGLLSGLPSTLLIALVFVALVQDRFFAARATTAVPVGLLIDTIFLMILILLLEGGLLRSIFISLTCWFGMAVLASRLMLPHILVSIGLYFLIAFGCYMWLDRVVRIPLLGKCEKRATVWSMVWRAVFAGSVVAGTTLLAAFAGPFWVGIFSTFPAVMLSSMVILTLTQSKGFARATGKVLIISSTNVVIFAYLVSLTYPSFGVIWGTLMGYGVSFCWILMVNKLMKLVAVKQQ